MTSTNLLYQMRQVHDMAAPHRVFTSPQFKFIVEGQPFYIHASIVSELSKPLDRMMNGEMSEAQAGAATLNDVDKDTFLRFAQWAYYNFYSAAEFTLDTKEAATSSSNEAAGTEISTNAKALAYSPASSPKPEFVDDAGDDPYILWRSLPKKRRFGGVMQSERTIHHLSAKADLKKAFTDRRVTFDSIGRPSPRANQSSKEDYTEVFLCHARLYVFADQYDIRDLRTLACEEIRAALIEFKLYTNRTGDIIALLRYVYANTCESKGDDEDLRTVLTHYVGYEIDTLMKDESFSTLMVEEGGTMLKDFMKMVAKRI